MIKRGIWDLFTVLVFEKNLGIGGAVNFQPSGKEIDTEWGSGQIIEELIGDLKKND